MKQREPPKGTSKVETTLDKFSNLPGHVVDQILSHLSIKEAVGTSILSSKWRYKWATLPNLVFDNQCVSVASQDQSVIKNKLVNIIDHVLLLHTGPIHKFKLSHRDLVGVTDIDRWILHLSRSAITEFILEIWKGQRYKLPSCLFSCQNLTHLELFNCLVKPPSTFQGFKSLKSLDLQHVTMTQDVFESLIASCPLLERLTLMNFDGFPHINIDAPNLLFFDIGGVFDDVTFNNTFQLALVSIGLYADDKISQWSTRSSSNLRKFFMHLPHIRRLEIQSYFLKVTPFPYFLLVHFLHCFIGPIPSVTWILPFSWPSDPSTPPIFKESQSVWQGKVKSGNKTYNPEPPPNTRIKNRILYVV